MSSVKKLIEWRQRYIRFDILNHPINSFQRGFWIRLVQHSRQQMLHAILQIKHPILHLLVPHYRNSSTNGKDERTHPFAKVNLYNKVSKSNKM